MDDVYNYGKNVIKEPGSIKVLHYLSGFGGLLALVGLITFAVLLNKNKNKVFLTETFTAFK